MATINGNQMSPFCPIAKPSGAGSSFAPDAANPSRQADQTPGTAASSANGQPKTNGQPATSGRTCAQNAANPSPNHRSGTGRDIAVSDAKHEQSNGATGSDEKQPRNGSVTPLNSRSFVDPPTVGNCAHCGADLKRKTRGGRVPIYCSSRCRVAAWRERQKAGRAATAVLLVFGLLLAIGMPVHAQDGNQPVNVEVNNNQVCEPGAVCTINSNADTEATQQQPPAPAPVEPATLGPTADDEPALNGVLGFIPGYAALVLMLVAGLWMFGKSDGEPTPKKWRH